MVEQIVCSIFNTNCMMKMFFRLGASKEREEKPFLGVRAIKRKEGRAISVCSTLIYYCYLIRIFRFLS